MDGKLELVVCTDDGIIYCLGLQGINQSGITGWWGEAGTPFRTNNIDGDGDYLDDITESYYDTDLTNDDSDGDALKDGYETQIFHSDPLKNDTDADKLNVCKVDIGTSIRQIVCGASNVRVGLDVVVATIGAVMPSGMVIKPVKLRGVESEGMICSASEIGLEDCQNGIIELDSSVGKYKLGQEASTIATFSDDLIEIELTANRGDCLSIRGVARDLSAAYDRPLIQTHINEDEDRRVGIGRILSLSHENNLDVNLRYRAVNLKDLTLPFIVRLRLAQIEDSREADIEALMLYVTHSSGVILRAYNYGFFCNENEIMAKVELSEDENNFAVIKSSEKASIVGVIQYDVSKVTYNEGTVLLEASYIPPDIISKKMSLSKIDSCPSFYRSSRGSEPGKERFRCMLSFRLLPKSH